MEFEVLFYFDENENTPVVAFLDDLARTQPRLHRLTTAGIAKLENRGYHGPPLTQMIDAEDDILELRVGNRDIARVFFYFLHGQRIVLTNGYVKKGQKLDDGELARARRYKRDWLRRFPEDI